MASRPNRAVLVRMRDRLEAEQGRIAAELAAVNAVLAMLPAPPPLVPGASVLALTAGESIRVNAAVLAGSMLDGGRSDEVADIRDGLARMRAAPAVDEDCPGCEHCTGAIAPQAGIGPADPI